MTEFCVGCCAQFESEERADLCPRCEESVKRLLAAYRNYATRNEVRP